MSKVVSMGHQRQGGGTFLKKSLHVLEDGASGVQVGDIEQVIVWVCFKYDKIT